MIVDSWCAGTFALYFRTTFVSSAQFRDNELLQPIIRLVVNLVALGKVADLDGDIITSHRRAPGVVLPHWVTAMRDINSVSNFSAHSEGEAVEVSIVQSGATGGS